jgi:hypothetical protein
LELTLKTRANGPLTLVVEDLSFGLPELPGQPLRARPEDTMPVPSYRTSDTTVVRRSFELGALPTDSPNASRPNEQD